MHSWNPSMHQVHLLKPFHRVIQAVDRTVGRVRRKRTVLVELHTPGHRAVLAPIYRRLSQLPGIDVWFTSEHQDRVRPLVTRGRFLSQADVAWRRFDLFMNADPWSAVRLRWCPARVNFFQGIAGKHGLDNPAELPGGFERYDRIAFVNRDRMNRCVHSGLVTPKQASLVGYPKLDDLAAGRIDTPLVRSQLGLDPSRPTILYAPTYSPASSLHLAGEQIVWTLQTAGLNVLVKLHDRSLDPDPRDNEGIDWRARMRALERVDRIHFVDTEDATPLLAVADAMVADHSSIGFEFLVTDRPLIIYDTPELAQTARINPQKVDLLRSAATVVHDVDELREAVRHELAWPGLLSAQRRQVAEEMFFDLGHATERALHLLSGLLGMSRRATGPVAGTLEQTAEHVS